MCVQGVVDASPFFEAHVQLLQAVLLHLCMYEGEWVVVCVRGGVCVDFNRVEITISSGTHEQSVQDLPPRPHHMMGVKPSLEEVRACLQCAHACGLFVELRAHKHTVTQQCGHMQIVTH